MKKNSVRILLAALLISTVFAVPVFAINLPTVEVHYKPTKDNSTSPHEMKFDDPVIEDEDSDDNLTASVIADGNMAIVLGIAAVAAGAVAVLVLKNRKVKKED